MLHKPELVYYESLNSKPLTIETLRKTNCFYICRKDVNNLFSSEFLIAELDIFDGPSFDVYGKENLKLFEELADIIDGLKFCKETEISLVANKELPL